MICGGSIYVLLSEAGLHMQYECMLHDREKHSAGKMRSLFVYPIT